MKSKKTKDRSCYGCGDLECQSRRFGEHDCPNWKSSKGNKKQIKQKIDPREIHCHENICFSLMDKKEEQQDKKSELKHVRDRVEKYRKQRINRGFDDSETWCLDRVIASFILPRLKRLKEISCAIPMYIANTEVSMPAELWNVLLDQMIETFVLIIEDKWSESEDYNTARKENDKRLDKINKGLHVFADYFIQLNW
jgi:hypothetical protein